MRVGKRKEKVTEAPTRARKSLVASSVGIPLPATWDSPRGQLEWQREVLRLLKVVGEARYVANGFGSAVSRCRYYMAELNEDGSIKGETSNRGVNKVFATSIASGIMAREELRILGTNLATVGECYITGLSGNGEVKDSWHAVSRNDITRSGGDVFIDIGFGKRKLIPGKDILARGWRPDPNKRATPDSSFRGARVALRGMEIITKYIFAQADSRLYTGGILIWPSGTSATGHEGTSSEDIIQQLVDLSAEAADGRGTAANVVPMVVEAPPETIGSVKYLSLAAELSKSATDILNMFTTRFARSVDIQPEEVLGMGDTNHWSSWQLRQETVDAQVTPLVACVCELLQRIWCGPALKAAGYDPEKYHIWFDTSPLTVRPQRLKDTLDLFREGIVSAQAVLEAGAYLDGDAPSTEEDIKRKIWELVYRDPQYFSNRAIRELLGIAVDDEAFNPPAIEATPPPPPPAPEITPQKHVLADVPNTQDKGAEPKALTASVATLLDRARADGAIRATAEAAVRRTMEIAGGRLLGPRERGQHPDVPRHELHTVVDVPTDRIAKLMDGSAQHVFALAEASGIGPADKFAASIGGYCAMLLQSGQRHDPGRLQIALKLGGLVDEG